MLVGTFNQEKALVGAFYVIVNLREPSFEALEATPQPAIILMTSSQTFKGSLKTKMDCQKKLAVSLHQNSCQYFVFQLREADFSLKE